eukprot:SAG31_NODE_526_length_14475_cov_5.135197_10_plen_42_part_00
MCVLGVGGIGAAQLGARLHGSGGGRPLNLGTGTGTYYDNKF